MREVSKTGDDSIFAHRLQSFNVMYVISKYKNSSIQWPKQTNPYSFNHFPALVFQDAHVKIGFN